jgi:hypothetical protein
MTKAKEAFRFATRLAKAVALYVAPFFIPLSAQWRTHAAYMREAGTECRACIAALPRWNSMLNTTDEKLRRTLIGIAKNEAAQQQFPRMWEQCDEHHLWVVMA